MSIGIGKTSNEYAQQLYGIDAPKTVWMAIAFSFARRIVGDDTVSAALTADLCLEEWRKLHANGIVPQKPRKA